MAKKKGFLKSRAGRNIMNIIYGIGASIVITGALFKILHWPGANWWLIIGMGTEAIVFFVSAFDFPEESSDYQWERVYPGLLDESGSSAQPAIDTSWTTEIAKLDGTVFEQLSGTMTDLNDKVGKLSGVADAATATNDYTEKVKTAADKIDTLNQSYSVAVESMNSLANATVDAQAYHEQIQTITRNLTSLNSVYELELQDAKTHLKALNQFYASMGDTMASMSEASKDAEAYRQGMMSLNQNLQRLNEVYGNMLSAMAGGTK